MDRRLSSLVVLAWLAQACAGASAPPAKSMAPTASSGTEAVAEAATLTADAWDAVPVTADPALPPVPWQARLAADGANTVLVDAWRRASNRSWCAPLTLAQVPDARPRSAGFEGGWAVEYDKRGMRGVLRNGRMCQNCGRGAFGIAGTSILVDEDADADETPVRVSWSDGSSAAFEPGESDGVVVATLKVRGQQCVYQVWTTAGEDHLKTLLDGLRLVDAH